MKSQGLTKVNLPAAPGVYFFVRRSLGEGGWKKGGEILYIGKATNLRDRVRSYFSSDLIDARGPGILDMVTQATNVEFEETQSVLEALILEANLIKKFQPKYNVKEKDNKSFNCVAITDEALPKILIIRQREAKQKTFKKVFGPFPNGTMLRDALKIIRKIFPFLDDASTKKDQVEFYRQLGLTPSGVRGEYLKNINHIRLFFEGKKKNVIKKLESDMKQYAKKHEFELAEIAKRKLFALQHINDVSLIKDESRGAAGEARRTESRDFRIEAYDIAHLSGKSAVGVMTVITNGMVDKSEYRKFKIRGQKGNDDYANLREVIMRRFNHSEWRTPDLIVIDGGVGQYSAGREALRASRPAGSEIPTIPLVSVIKDSHHKPKAFHGNEDVIKKYKKSILLANSESHRFAIGYHKQARGKNFLGI